MIGVKKKTSSPYRSDPVPVARLLEAYCYGRDLVYRQAVVLPKVGPRVQSVAPWKHSRT